MSMDPAESHAPRPVRSDVVVFPAGMLAATRQHLLADAPLESAGFILARPVRTPAGTWRLVAFEFIGVESTDYAGRTTTTADLPPTVVARAIERARRVGASVVLVHTHPENRPTGPSDRDRATEARLLPTLARRIPHVPHARLILGSALTHAVVFVPVWQGRAQSESTLAAHDVISDVQGNPVLEARPLAVHEVGRDVHIHSPTIVASEHQPASTPIFDRQVRAFGAAGQVRLRSLRVAIVGLGGTGSIVVEQLAYLGIGGFFLVDPDEIDPTNLNRVVGATRADVGRRKVDVAAAGITRIAPEAHVAVSEGDVRDQAVARQLLDVDFFFGCTDSEGSRAVLSQVAAQFAIPGIDLGVAIQASEGVVTHVTGRVQMLTPGLACLLCSHVLNPEAVRRDLLTAVARSADPYVMGETVLQPAVISINGAAASLAVTMFLSAVVGIPVAARHQRLRLESGIVASISTDPAPACPWCSASGGLARGDSWAMPGRGEEVV